MQRLLIFILTEHLPLHSSYIIAHVVGLGASNEEAVALTVAVVSVGPVIDDAFVLATLAVAKVERVVVKLTTDEATKVDEEVTPDALEVPFTPIRYTDTFQLPPHI